MSFKDCLTSAVEQGEINTRQADELDRYYNARFEKNRANMSDAEARAAAQAEVSAELKAEALEKRRQALLAEAKRKELAAIIPGFTGIRGKKNPLNGALSLMVNFGGKGMRSMLGREHAIISMVHRDLAEMMHHFRRTKLTGSWRNQGDLPDLVRALNSENTSNPTMNAMASGVSEIFETLRQRFNKAGGNIPERQGFDLTHTHNARKMIALNADRNLAKDEWKAFIRPLLDPELMTNPNTGATIGEAGLDDSLEYVWESIISKGWAHRSPQARKFGTGPISGKYQNARFLQFRDADSWLKYNEQFGERDVISTLFNQINSISRDIAAMETFGPNPDAMIEWMKQSIRVDVGRNQASVTPTRLEKLSQMSKGEIVDYRIDSLWRNLRGRGTVWQKPASLAGDVRNVASAAMLGSTGVLAAATDPFIAASARALAGLPIFRFSQNMFTQLAKDLNNSQGALSAAKHAVMWEDFLNVFNDNARFVDQMMGHEWSKTLVDRALTVNALKPLTAARKRLEASAWHSELGRLAKTDWIDMPESMKRVFEGFGLGADDWHKMRTGVGKDGFLDPGSVLDKTGDLELAERYAEMIAGWNERSVPTSDPRIKSVVTGSTQRGTLTGEAADFASQFLGFGMSFTARQLEAVYMFSMLGSGTGERLARGAGYTIALSTTMALGAAFYEQFKALADGKDPVAMDTAEFWAKAFIKGGGGGLFADFVSRSENRFGQSFAEQLPGPGMSLVGDTFDVTIANALRLIRGEETNAGRKVSNYLGRYAPIVSSHPATRLIWRRWFIDNLQWLTDPDADKSFKAKKRRAAYWWNPGEATPRRGVDLF